MNNQGKRNWSTSLLLFVSCISLIPYFGKAQKTAPRLKARAIDKNIDDYVPEFEALVPANTKTTANAASTPAFGNTFANYPSGTTLGSTSPFGSTFGQSPFGSSSPFTSNTGFGTSPFTQYVGSNTLNNGFGANTLNNGFGTNSPFPSNTLPTLPSWGSNLASSNPFQTHSFGSNSPFTSSPGNQASFPFIDDYPGSNQQQFGGLDYAPPSDHLFHALNGGNEDGEWQLIPVPGDEDYEDAWLNSDGRESFDDISSIPRVTDVYNLNNRRAPKTRPSRNSLDRDGDGEVSEDELHTSIAKALDKLLDKKRDDDRDYDSDDRYSDDDYNDDDDDDDDWDSTAPSPAPIWKSLKSNGSPRSTSRKSSKSSNRSTKTSPKSRLPERKPKGLKSGSGSNNKPKSKRAKSVPPLSARKQEVNGRPSWNTFLDNDRDYQPQRGWDSDDSNYRNGRDGPPYRDGNGSPYNDGNGPPYRDSDGPPYDNDDWLDQRNWDSNDYDRNNNGGGGYQGPYDGNNGRNPNSNDDWYGNSQFRNGQDQRNWDVNNSPGGIPANIWNRGPPPSAPSDKYDGDRDWNFLNPGLGGPLQTPPNLAVGGVNPPWVNNNYPPGNNNPVNSPFNGGGGGGGNGDTKNWSLDQWYDYYYQNGWNYDHNQKRWIQGASTSTAASAKGKSSSSSSSPSPSSSPSGRANAAVIQEFAPLMRGPPSPSLGPVRSSFSKRDISTLMSAVDKELKSTP